MTSVTDESGTLSEYEHCPTCSEVTGALYPQSKSLIWNLNGDFDVTSFVDARNYSTTYEYGHAGELKKRTYPDGLATTFSYKTNGLLEYETIGFSSVKYSYDAARRLTGVSLTGNSTNQITHAYRADNLPTTIVDQSGTRTYSYYSNRWLEKVTYNLTALGISASQEVGYTYNPDGTVDTLTWKSGGTTVQSWSYSYDGAGRVDTVSNSLGESTTYAYDGEGKILTQSNSNGTSEIRTYNEDRNWPTLVEQKVGATTFASYALEYDGGLNTVGNLTEVTERDGSVMTYGYDTLYRLESETRTGTGPYSRTYGYDLANNVTTVNGSAFATYDNGNKFNTISGGSKSYDSRGNLISASYSGFSLSGLNFNTLFKMDGSTGRFHNYNAKGYRGATRQSSPSNSPWTVFIYSGDTIIGEVTPSGATVAYTWGPSGIISERLLTGTPKSLWYHFGPQGETRHLTDSTGAVADSYRYNAYGQPTATTGTDFNPFRYGGSVGYYTDANVANLILAGHRWYSPGLYRWLTRDPISYDGGDNPYSYVGGNPIRFVDPTGLICYYRQSTGAIRCEDANGNEYYSADGYSGRGESRNNPEAQGRRDQGPIPRGRWQVGPWQNNPRTGRNTSVLLPEADNECHDTGRDCTSFRAHGDNAANDASTGCIILPPDRTAIPPGEIIVVTE